MSNVLNLFTTLDDINVIKVSEEDGTTLQEGDHILRNGESIKLFITECKDEGNSWVICGGYTFREFQTELACQNYFFDLQKGKEDLYE